jgi:cytochrome c oxidase subunit 2
MTPTMNNSPHFTTRRGFIAATGFGGVSLYGLWAAYGAAPSPLALLGLEGGHNETTAPGTDQAPDAPTASGGHGGHGASAAGPDPKEFSRLTAEFSERYRMPDGSVYPRQLTIAPTDHSDPHAEHGDAAAMTTTANNPPIDVLMTAGRWFYLPNMLRLDAGQPYRFRMMALDITHGASIQFGKGGRMMRLQPGQLSESELTFHKPGHYLMLCTVYCGAAHDMMQATIEVV